MQVVNPLSHGHLAPYYRQFTWSKKGNTELVSQLKRFDSLVINFCIFIIIYYSYHKVGAALIVRMAGVICQKRHFAAN